MSPREIDPLRLAEQPEEPDKQEDSRRRRAVQILGRRRKRKRPMSTIQDEDDQQQLAATICWRCEDCQDGCRLSSAATSLLLRQTSCNNDKQIISKNKMIKTNHHHHATSFKRSPATNNKTLTTINLKMNSHNQHHHHPSRRRCRQRQRLVWPTSTTIFYIMNLLLVILISVMAFNGLTTTNVEAAAAPAEVNVIQQQCRDQARNNLQVSNFSQIAFEPVEICATWAKMLRQQSPNNNDQQQPWTFIEKLDLSSNRLTVLHDSTGLGKLINLKQLRIAHNELTRCEGSSLVGLRQLQTLDLSHNKLQTLPPKIFQPIRGNLKKLILSHNQISVLAPSLFDGLNQLEHLDLSHNEITSHWLDDLLFQNLSQLHYLDLSFNRLTIISSQATFISLQQLETLSLQHNELRQVPETIQHLRQLSSLDLSQNMIGDISNASYLSNCRYLFNLNLESNSLENVTRDAFIDLPALKVLNLASNKIQHLDQQAFEFVPDLHALRLDSNKLVDFGQSFVNLRFLLMLNISNNRISSFDYAQIPLGLQWLDLHSNKIDKLNNFYYSPTAQQQFAMNNNNENPATIGQQWSSLLRLTTLDASHNLIREIDNTSLPESLETVQLNNNQLRTISSHTFSSKSNLTRINLSSNLLTTMPLEALKLTTNRDITTQSIQSGPAAAAAAISSSSTLAGSSSNMQQHNNNKFVDIYLANNPFVCNCDMGWLSQLLLASSSLNPPVPATLNNNNNYLNLNSNYLNSSLSSTSNPSNLFASPTTSTNISNSNIVISSSNPSSVNNQMLLLREHQLIMARQLPRIADAHLVSCHLSFARQAAPYYVAAPNYVQQAASLLDPQLHRQQQQLWSPVMAANQLALQMSQQHQLRNNHHYQQTSSASSSINYRTSQQQQQQATAAASKQSIAGDSLILRQSELLASVHLCSYKSPHCFALCNCCDFDACDCQISCPDNCSCYYAHAWSMNIVDCSATNQLNNNNFNQPITSTSHHHGGHHHSPYSSTSMNSRTHGQSTVASRLNGQQQQLVKFTRIPERIPIDVTDLYLDGLQLVQLRSNALIGRNKLKTLYLNDSQIHVIERKAFAHQKSLRLLQLNSNQLKQLAGYEFEEQTELRELYLANNRLSHIADHTFSALKSLQVLHLQNNQIYHLDFWTNFQQQAAPNNNKLIMSIHLGNNPWSCQCDYVEPMLRWLHANVKHIADRRSITCQFNETSALHLLTSINDNNQQLSSLSSSSAASSTSSSSATGNNPVDELLDNMMMMTSSINNGASAAYDQSMGEYADHAMFDASRCLNHTVYSSPSSILNNLDSVVNQNPTLTALPGAEPTNNPSGNGNFPPQTPNDDPLSFVSTDKSAPVPAQQITTNPSQQHQHQPSAYHQFARPTAPAANYPSGDNLAGDLMAGSWQQASATNSIPSLTNNRQANNNINEHNNILQQDLPGKTRGSSSSTAATSSKLNFHAGGNTTTNWLITFIALTLIAILIVVSLIHYRRPMGQWLFYSPYGLQMLPATICGGGAKGATKSQHHHHHHHQHHTLQHHTLHPHDSLVINKQHSSFAPSSATITNSQQLHHQHHQHLQAGSQLHNHQLQYGVSSAGSTSSSSAASTNLTSQAALCQAAGVGQAGSPTQLASGLATTPLIVANNNQQTSSTLNHRHQLMNSSQSHAPNNNYVIGVNSSSSVYQQQQQQTSSASSKTNEEEKLFDAYLTYSKFDEQLVNERIAPELECGQPAYRIALRHRDLPPQSSDFLSDCIIETANASRRIVLLLSEPFLLNEWMQAQFRSAHLEALSQCDPSRLVVVLLARPESLGGLLDAELARWLKLAGATIHYQDKAFWARFKTAMQHNGLQETHSIGHNNPRLLSIGQPATLLGQANGRRSNNNNNGDSSGGGGLFGKSGFFSGFLFNSGGQDNSSSQDNKMMRSVGATAATTMTKNKQQNMRSSANPLSCHQMLFASDHNNHNNNNNNHHHHHLEHHYGHMTTAQQQQLVATSSHSTLGGSSANIYQQPIYADSSQQQHLATSAAAAANADSLNGNNTRRPVHI